MGTATTVADRIAPLKEPATEEDVRRFLAEELPRLRGLSLRDREEAVAVALERLSAVPGTINAEMRVRLALGLANGSQAPESAGYPTVRAAEVEIEPVDWVWYPRIPSSALTILAGDGGAGKSTIAAALEADITQGRPLPSDDAPPTANGPANVLIVSHEDTFKHVTVPRLNAAGADLDRVFLLDLAVTEWIDLDEPEDLRKLEATIASVRPAWVRFDPLASYLGKTDSHKDASVRRTLGPLSLIAERYECVILAVIHLNKGDKKPIERIMGSVAFKNYARSVLMAGLDLDDPTESSGAVTHEKVNATKKAGPIGYQIVGTTVSAPDGTPVPTSRIEWTGPSSLTAEHLFCRTEAGEPGKLEEAEEFVLAELEGGAVPTKDIQRDSKEQGFSWTTVERAKRSLKDKGIVVKADKEKGRFNGRWYWELAPENPDQAEPSRDGSHEDRQRSLRSTKTVNVTDFEGIQARSQHLGSSPTKTVKRESLTDFDESRPQNMANPAAPEPPADDDDCGEIDDPEPEAEPAERTASPAELSEDARACVEYAREHGKCSPYDAWEDIPVFRGRGRSEVVAVFEWLRERGIFEASGSAAAPRYDLARGVTV